MVFSRERFVQIFWALHVPQDTCLARKPTCGSETWSILKYTDENSVQDRRYVFMRALLDSKARSHSSVTTHRNQRNGVSTYACWLTVSQAIYLHLRTLWRYHNGMEGTRLDGRQQFIYKVDGCCSKDCVVCSNRKTKGGRGEFSFVKCAAKIQVSPKRVLWELPYCEKHKPSSS